jgi:hypothetical protein
VTTNRIRFGLPGIPVVLLVAACFVSPVSAQSSTYKDVCTSGCTYSSLQDAIDAISDSSATKVYTVFVDSGVLSVDAPMTMDGKSYINIVGHGEGVSIVRASSDYFTNAPTAHVNFLDLTDCTNVTLRGLTFDARTNDPGNIDPTTKFLNGILLQNNDRILFDSVEVRAVNYGIWESAGTAGNLIEVYNSKVLSTATALLVKGSLWHIFSSEIKALQTGSESASDLAVALDLVNGVNTTVWGSHLHAESSKSGASGTVAAMRVNSVVSGELAVIGTQLHVKIGTTNIGSSSRSMFGFYCSSATGTSHYDFVGSDIHYESPASISQGRLGGIGYNGTGGTQVISFVGSGIYDLGGSGGTYRSNIIQNSSFGTAPQLRTAGANIGSAVAASGSLPSGLASGAATLTNQRGSVTLSGGTASVTLPATVPDTSYSVAVSTGVNETMRVTGKSTSGFTVTSSNGSSTATVDWILVR